MIKKLHTTSNLALLAFVVLMIMPGRGWGQTNPTAQALPYTQNFGTSTFTTMPAGMAAWNGLNSATLTTQALAEASTPTGDATIAAATASTTSGGTFGYAVSSNARPYVQTSSNTTNGANQLALAIVTSGKTNIVIAYDVEIINASPRTVGIVMQYRNGTSGSWTTVTGTGNPYSQAAGTTGVKANASVTLPLAAENQAVVQIRWATWRGTESGNSSGIAIDNLSVTGSVASCTDPTTQASIVTFSTVLSDQMTVGWTRGGTPGDGVIVVAKAGSAPDDPTDLTAYTANAAFGSGTPINTNTYVVYMGTATSVNVTALSASTTYYYKVYEKNCTGTSIMINTTNPAANSQATTAACAENPTITTTVGANTILPTTASSGGQTIGSGANCAITAKGVCWNTSTSPTIANSKTTDGTGTADFTSSLTSLSAQTLYYVRAYATNFFGTAYANEITFRTLSTELAAHPASFTATASSSSQINLSFSAASTITNADGYILLRRTGTNPSITNINDGIAPTSLSMPSGTTFVTDINSTSTATYNNTGLPSPNTQYNYEIIAYNWDGTNPQTYNYYTAGTTKVANATTMTQAMILPYTQDFEGATTEWTLAPTGTNKWAIGSATNNGGAKALYISSDAGTSNIYVNTTQTGTDATVRIDLTGETAATLSFEWKSNGEINYDYGEVYINTGGSDILLSAAQEFISTTIFASKRISLTPYVGGIISVKFRWINDGSVAYQPPFAVDNVAIAAGDFATLTTTSASAIAVNSASSGGNISAGGGSTITARGVCYGTSSNPTISGSKTNDGTGTGAFTSSISGLTDNTLYYARAYATNTTGTAYGSEISFTTSSVSAPTTTAASGVSPASFNANWEAVTGAASYKLDVSASSTFGTSTPTTLTEGFETGLTGGYTTGNLTLGSGIWGFVDGGLKVTTAGTFNSGLAACQLKATTGIATSPSLNNVGTVTFYAKSPSGSTSLTIKKVVSGVTTTIITKTLSSSWAQYSVDVNDNNSAVQIIFANGANYIYLDDVSIGYSTLAPSFVTGYNNLSVAETSQAITGIAANTLYYYRVRALGSNSTSVNSGTITVTTAAALAEPTNYATNFTAASNTSTSISLTWSDATGAQLPEYYLVKAVVGSSAPSAPVDGTAQADATLVKNIAYGTQACTFTGLTANTTYTFSIWPYTNTGININYKTDGTVPSATASAGGYFRSYSSGNWGTPGTWQYSADGSTNWATAVVEPSGGDVVTILNTHHVSVEATLKNCKNLSIASGAILTINAGMSLTVNGTLTNNAGNTGLVLKSDDSGTGSLIHNTTGVAATVERYVTGDIDLTQMKYHMVSIPLTSGGTSAQFTDSYLFDFSEGSNQWNALGASTSTSLNNLKGYLMYYPLGSNSTLSFTGSLNSGSFTALTTGSTNDNTHGWNLVPNPYPSAIDWSASGWIKTNLDGGIYFWPAGASASSANYCSYVSGVGTGTPMPTKYIPVGQSFFVHATSGSPVLTMDNTVRVHNNQAFYKSASEALSNLLRLTVNANNSADQLALRFTADATSGFDGNYETYKMQGGIDAPQLSSVITDGTRLSINALPFTSGDVIVPLAFSLNASTDVTFTASGMESFYESIPMYLEDLTTGTITDLRANPVYTFSHTAGDAGNRFRLRFKGVTGTPEQPTTTPGHVFVSQGKLFVDIPAMQQSMATLSVFDALGRQLISRKEVLQGIVQLPAPTAPGVYIVRVMAGNMSFTGKVVVNQ